MQKLITVFLATALCAACGKKETTEGSFTPVAKTESESRVRLLDGANVSVTELETLGKSFGEKLTGLTLPEAKECWVTLYTQTYHFESGNPSAFSGDFSQPGRESSVANQMTFAYYGFDAAVKRLEREMAKEEMSDAPESVQKQILRAGDFHRSVVSLARCKYEDIAIEDKPAPYFQIFCEGAGIGQRNSQYATRSKMQDHCNQMASSFLETGDIKPDLLEDTPMRQ